LGYVESSIKDLRRIIKAQRSPLLNQGLPLALDGLIRDMQTIAGHSTSITWQNNIHDTLSLSDEQATSIFRIAQEALTNAIKHARARNITVGLEQDPNRLLRLRVADDGTGIQEAEQGQPDPNHFGQALMYERAMMIDATLQIQSHPEQGTDVLLEVAL